MSEKIVQLNEEVIKGQLKELVRGSVEETLSELLEAEAEKLPQAARHDRKKPVRAPAAVTMTGTLPPHSETLRFMCLASRAFLYDFAANNMLTAYHICISEKT